MARHRVIAHPWPYSTPHKSIFGCIWREAGTLKLSAWFLQISHAKERAVVKVACPRPGRPGWAGGLAVLRRFAAPKPPSFPPGGGLPLQDEGKGLRGGGSALRISPPPHGTRRVCTARRFPHGETNGRAERRPLPSRRVPRGEASWQAASWQSRRSKPARRTAVTPHRSRRSSSWGRGQGKTGRRRLWRQQQEREVQAPPG